jgi:hypothetical protein
MQYLLILVGIAVLIGIIIVVVKLLKPKKTKIITTNPEPEKIEFPLMVKETPLTLDEKIERLNDNVYEVGERIKQLTLVMTEYIQSQRGNGHKPESVTPCEIKPKEVSLFEAVAQLQTETKTDSQPETKEVINNSQVKGTPEARDKMAKARAARKVKRIVQPVKREGIETSV